MPLSENQAKVLGALAQAEHHLPVREICRLTELSEYVAGRDIAELERSGLATGTGRGWQITSRGRALFRKPVIREYGR